MKLEIYDKEKTYLFPTGKVATSDVMSSEYDAVDYFTVALELEGNVIQEIHILDNLKDKYELNKSNLSDTEIVKKIQEIIEKEREESGSKDNRLMQPVDSAERIAAQLELKNMLEFTTAEEMKAEQDAMNVFERIATALESIALNMKGRI